jgi:hypothetical protein
MARTYTSSLGDGYVNEMRQRRARQMTDLGARADIQRALTERRGLKALTDEEKSRRDQLHQSLLARQISAAQKQRGQVAASQPTGSPAGWSDQPQAQPAQPDDPVMLAAQDAAAQSYPQAQVTPQALLDRFRQVRTTVGRDPGGGATDLRTIEGIGANMLRDQSQADADRAWLTKALASSPTYAGNVRDTQAIRGRMALSDRYTAGDPNVAFVGGTRPGASAGVDGPRKLVDLGVANAIRQRQEQLKAAQPRPGASRPTTVADIDRQIENLTAALTQRQQAAGQTGPGPQPRVNETGNLSLGRMLDAPTPNPPSPLRGPATTPARATVGTGQQIAAADDRVSRAQQRYLDTAMAGKQGTTATDIRLGRQIARQQSQTAATEAQAKLAEAQRPRTSGTGTPYNERVSPSVNVRKLQGFVSAASDLIGNPGLDRLSGQQLADELAASGLPLPVTPQTTGVEVKQMATALRGEAGRVQGLLGSGAGLRADRPIDAPATPDAYLLFPGLWYRGEDGDVAQWTGQGWFRPHDE